MKGERERQRVSEWNMVANINYADAKPFEKCCKLALLIDVSTDSRYCGTEILGLLVCERSK